MAVPQYESLSVKEIKKFIAVNPYCSHYLPDEKEMEKLPKQWLCNILVKITGGKFKQWVQEKILVRNQGLVKEKKLAINIDPKLMQAFFKSTAVSSKSLLPTPSIFYLLIQYLHYCSTKGKRRQHAEGRHQAKKNSC